MAHVEVPPPVGSSGQAIDALIINAGTSELRQIHIIADPVSSSAMASVTSSGGLLITVSNPSTAVTFTNAATTQVNTLSSGPILVLSSGPVTGTVNTLSSGPVLVLSSGPATIAGTVTVLSASSGLVQISGIPTVIAASSAGHQVGSLTSGIVSPSSNWTVVLSSIPSLSSGTVTLSSAPLVIVATSGGTIPVTLSTVFNLSSAPLVIVATSGGTVPVTLSTVFSLSSVPTVTATAATNPWSSAPGFNVPVVSASSGVIQLSSQITVATTGTLIIVSASSGFVQAWLPIQTGAGFGPVTSSYGILQNPAWGQTSSRLIIATSVSKISSAPGVLSALVALSTATAAAGAFVRLYDQTTGNATSANNSGLAGACKLLRISSSVASMPYEEAYYWPQGIKFATACSFDIVLNATSTATNAIAGWVSAQYTS